MNTKIRLFKHTFIVLSIMCCIMLGSTSIIYALSDINSFGIPAQESRTPSAAQTAAAPSTVVVSDQTQTASSESTEAQATITKSTETAKETATPIPSTPTKSNSSPITGAPSKASATGNESPGNSDSSPADDTGVSPSQPEKEPQSPEATKPGTASTVTISAVGDIMAHQSNLNNAYNPKTGTYDFTGFLEYVKPYLSKSDLTIGNFETVTAGPKTGFTSYPSFNTPDSLLTALSWAGFDILSTANNHSLDRGVNGLNRTIQLISKNKMVNIGSSTNGKDKYILKEINGIKLGILAYSGLYNGVDRKLNAAQKNTYLSPINEQQMQKDIKAAKAGSADAVIVVVHWGTEYQREPNSYQTTLAKKLLSWGADIILGSHPHVIQKSEIVKIDGKDKFIIYSMGNFISGYRRVDKAKRPNKIFTEDGIIVNLQLEKDPEKGTIIKGINYVPTWVDKYYANNRPVYKIIPIPSPEISGKYVNDYNRAFIKQSYKNTMGIMAKMK